jgi:hypothetical protein
MMQTILGIKAKQQLFNLHNSKIKIICTFGSATLCLSGFLISYLIVGTPNTLLSSPSLTIFLNPCRLLFPKSSSALTSYYVA